VHLHHDQLPLRARVAVAGIVVEDTHRDLAAVLAERLRREAALHHRAAGDIGRDVHLVIDVVDAHAELVAVVVEAHRQQRSVRRDRDLVQAGIARRVRRQREGHLDRRGPIRKGVDQPARLRIVQPRGPRSAGLGRTCRAAPGQQPGGQRHRNGEQGHSSRESLHRCKLLYGGIERTSPYYSTASYRSIKSVKKRWVSRPTTAGLPRGLACRARRIGRSSARRRRCPSEPPRAGRSRPAGRR